MSNPNDFVIKNGVLTKYKGEGGDVVIPDGATSIGNASAEGAAALLVSSEAARRERELVDACTYIELSTSAAFNEFYIDEMEFEL